MANEKSRTLQDIMRSRERDGFTGRSAELAFFRENLALSVDDERRRFVFSVYGDGGVGKTFLISRLLQIAQSTGRVTALVDDSVYDPPEALKAIADQFADQGVKLKRFEQGYDAHQKRRHDLEAGRDPSETPLSHIGHAAVRAGMGALQATAVGGAVAGVLDSKDAVEIVDQSLSAAVDRARRRSNPRTLGSEVGELTSLFLQDLSRLGKPAALFFDVYERTSAFLDGWLRSLLIGTFGDLPPDFVLTVAGRYRLDASRWSPFLWMQQDVPLTPFTESEVRQVLTRQGISDEHVVQAILSLSGGLPLSVSMLARSRPTDAMGVLDPAGSVVDRFLQWEDDSARQEIALVGALPRYLDRDVFKVLMRDATDSEVLELHSWLTGQAFVSTNAGRGQYHNVVRDPMMRLCRSRSSEQWRALHRSIADAHERWRASLGLADEAGWFDPSWQEHMVEEVYHRLCAGGAQALSTALERAVFASIEGVGQARRWAQMISAAGRDSATAFVTELGDRLQAALSDETNGLVRFQDEALCHPGLTAIARVEAFRLRGRQHRLNARYSDALADFTRAVQLDPRSSAALGGRAEAYRLMGRFEDALADFDKAIELDPSDDWAIGTRGGTYRQMGRFEDALADLDRAIELDPAFVWAIWSRGETYRRLGRFEDALADFDKAIKLDPAVEGLFWGRGEVYRQMGRFEDALADFDKAVELDPAADWILSRRGDTYREMGRFEDALADFDKAIELNPTADWILSKRGDTYHQMGRFEDALADLDKAIELDPAHVLAIWCRGETYRLMGRFEEALADFDKAIELDPTNLWVMGLRGEAYRQMGRFEDALADLDKAVEVDPPSVWIIGCRGEAYRQMGRFEDALADFDRAVELHPAADWIFANRGETYHQMGRFEDALTDLDRAVELNPVYDEALARRAETYRLMGRHEEAVADFDKVIELNPTDEWAVQRRAELAGWLKPR